jgi:hypothetical protein
VPDPAGGWAAAPIRGKDAMAENVNIESDDEDPDPQELEVVAHSEEEELPCGGFACGMFGKE